MRLHAFSFSVILITSTACLLAYLTQEEKNPVIQGMKPIILLLPVQKCWKDTVGWDNRLLLLMVAFTCMAAFQYSISFRQLVARPVQPQIVDNRRPVSYATPRRHPRPTPELRSRLWQELIQTSFIVNNILEPYVTAPSCPYWADNVGMQGLSVYTAFFDFDAARKFYCFHPNCSFGAQFGNKKWLSEEDWEAERDRALEQMIEHLRQHAGHYPFACAGPLPAASMSW